MELLSGRKRCGRRSQKELDKEIESFMNGDMPYFSSSYIGKLFILRMNTYYKMSTLANNTKSSKARTLYMMLKRASFNMDLLEQIILQEAPSAEHMKQLKSCIKSGFKYVKTTDAGEAKMATDIVSMTTTTHQTLDPFDQDWESDSEEGDQYESKCIKFLVFILNEYVMRMLHDVEISKLSHRIDFTKKNMRRWVFTISALYLYIFPLRNSSLELVKKKGPKVIGRHGKYVLLEFKDSKRTSKLMRKASYHTMKDKAKVKVLRAVPDWCDTLTAWYVDNILPRLRWKHGGGQGADAEGEGQGDIDAGAEAEGDIDARGDAAGQGDIDAGADAEGQGDIDARGDAEGQGDIFALLPVGEVVDVRRVTSCLYGAQVKRRSAFIPVNSVSSWCREYVAKEAKKKGTKVKMMNSTDMRTFFASVTQQRGEAKVVHQLKEHTDATRTKYYTVNFMSDAVSQLNQYLTMFIAIAKMTRSTTSDPEDSLQQLREDEIIDKMIRPYVSQ